MNALCKRCLVNPVPASHWSCQDCAAEYAHNPRGFLEKHGDAVGGKPTAKQKQTSDGTRPQFGDKSRKRSQAPTGQEGRMI